MEKNKRIVKKIVYFVSAAAMLILLASVFVSMFLHTRSSILNSRERTIVQSSVYIDNTLIESISAIERAAYKVSDMLGDDSSNKDILEYLTSESEVLSYAIRENFTGIYGVFNGEYLDGVGWVPDAGYDPYSRPWYRTAIDADGDVALVSPYVDMQTNSIIMSVSKLLADRKSVISMDVTLDDIEGFVCDQAVDHGWESMMVIDMDGDVVAHDDPGEVSKNCKSLKLYQAVMENLPNLSNGSMYFTFDHNGHRDVIYVADIHGTWLLVAGISEMGLLKDLMISYILYSVLLLIIMIGAVIAMYKTGTGSKDTESKLVLNALSTSYINIQIIDLKSDTFSEIAINNDSLETMLKDKHENAQYTLRVIMDSLINPRFKKRVFDFIDFSTLDERLKNKKYDSMIYLDIKNHRVRGIFIPYEYAQDGTLTKVVWASDVIEKEKGRVIYEDK